MLKAAKNNYKGDCRKSPTKQGLLASPVSQPNYYDYMGQIWKNTLFQLKSKGIHLKKETLYILALHKLDDSPPLTLTLFFTAILAPFYT